MKMTRINCFVISYAHFKAYLYRDTERICSVFYLLNLANNGHIVKEDDVAGRLQGKIYLTVWP